jgi:hypothetical protein
MLLVLMVAAASCTTALVNPPSILTEKQSGQRQLNADLTLKNKSN